MSEFINRVRELIAIGDVRASDHGYDKLASEDLSFRELVAGVVDAVVVEEYPNFPKGSCVLLLQRDHRGQPVHTVWGISKGYDRPIVLITAYRPDPKRWHEDFLKRRL